MRPPHKTVSSYALLHKTLTVAYVRCDLMVCNDAVLHYRMRFLGGLLTLHLIKPATFFVDRYQCTPSRNIIKDMWVYVNKVTKNGKELCVRYIPLWRDLHAWCTHYVYKGVFLCCQPNCVVRAPNKTYVAILRQKKNVKSTGLHWGIDITPSPET
jgi:hypothetical protein